MIGYIYRSKEDCYTCRDYGSGFVSYKESFLTCCICNQNKCRGCAKFVDNKKRNCKSCGKEICPGCFWTFNIETVKCDYCSSKVQKCSYRVCSCGEEVVNEHQRLNVSGIMFPRGKNKRYNNGTHTFMIEYIKCEICGEDTIHNTIINKKGCCSFSTRVSTNVCCKEECIRKCERHDIKRDKVSTCKGCHRYTCQEHSDKINIIDNIHSCKGCEDGLKKRTNRNTINNSCSYKERKSINSNYDKIMEEHLSLIDDIFEEDNIEDNDTENIEDIDIFEDYTD